MHQPSVHTQVGDEFGNLEANLDFLNRTDLLQPDSPMLEIGTGRGGMLNYLRSSGFNVQGVEINPKHIKRAKERFGDLPITQVKDAILPFDNDTFEIVLSFDVIEHIPDPDEHLREITRILKPGGHYLLQTPNKWTNTVFETLRHRSWTRWRSDHCSLHTRSQLRKRFVKHGFSITFHEIPVVTEFFKTKVRHTLGTPGMILLKVANPDRWPKCIKTNIYAVAKLEPSTAI